MKYYLMCKKVLGQNQFDDLIKRLTDQIINKFSSNIFLDRYMEILEYNIRLIMIISISNVLKLSEEEKLKRISLKDTEGFFVAKNLSEFEENNKFFINKITNLLK